MEQVAKSEVVLQMVDKLKNSKTDEEFNENLKQYTLKLNEIAVELEKQKELIKTLRNQNRMLTIEKAQMGIDIINLQSKCEKLEEQLHQNKPPEKSELLLDEMSMNLDKTKEKKK